jgi:hydrogenase maturation protein HypF
MRVRVLVQGIVQGVGFRPYVYGLANRLALRGFVRNDPGGVTIEVEGPPPAIDAFLSDLVETAPPLARIERVSSQFVDPTGDSAFSIVASEGSGGGWLALVSPDVATCGDCLAEIRDPAARRYGYAFTNCTNCGPRFTITTDIPYDRPNTTMAGFPMCEACRAEYRDPGDRRFHAQPIACPGPVPGKRWGPVPICSGAAVSSPSRASAAITWSATLATKRPSASCGHGRSGRTSPSPSWHPRSAWCSRSARSRTTRRHC